MRRGEGRKVGIYLPVSAEVAVKVGKDLDYEPWNAHIEIIETLVEEDDFPNYVERLIILRRTFSSVFATKPSSATQSQNGS